jgi:hypothetical protein
MQTIIAVTIYACIAGTSQCSIQHLPDTPGLCHEGHSAQSHVAWWLNANPHMELMPFPNDDRGTKIKCVTEKLDEGYAAMMQQAMKDSPPRLMDAPGMPEGWGTGTGKFADRLKDKIATAQHGYDASCSCWR